MAKKSIDFFAKINSTVYYSFPIPLIRDTEVADIQYLFLPASTFHLPDAFNI